ncbi:fimbrial protein [Halomonas urumqiensis]|uniref:fimbrial protein n=1 Tax=Halomonas urumqiensis TaxID=1684789 RepID=UPI0015E103AD|nr:fimbrial protein [Halomonas urumqiensis]GHE20786.1 outer membrane usher protein [Halomonas urumqiensis]
MNAELKSTKMHKAGLFSLLATVLLLPEAAKACTMNDPYHQAQNIIMELGQVIIPPDAEVGEMLAAQEFPITRVADIIDCGSSGGFAYGDIQSGQQPSAIDPEIYTTNVQGVGIRLSRRLVGSSLADLVVYPHTFSLNPNTNYSLAEGYFRVEIFKIAQQTGSGPLLPGQYTSYYIGGYQDTPILTSEVVGEGITVVSSSCKLDAGSRNIAVDFGSVPSARFTGVGVTHTPRDFSIGMTCNGPNVGEDVAALSFEYTADTAAPAAAGVIRLQQGVDAASGMGIQLLGMPGEAPVANGEVLELGTVQAGQERQFTQDMRARYYQTQANVTSGLTRAQATFNIEYR